MHNLYLLFLTFEKFPSVINLKTSLFYEFKSSASLTIQMFASLQCLSALQKLFSIFRSFSDFWTKETEVLDSHVIFHGKLLYSLDYTHVFTYRLLDWEEGRKMERLEISNNHMAIAKFQTTSRDVAISLIFNRINEVITR